MSRTAASTRYGTVPARIPAPDHQSGSSSLIGRWIARSRQRRALGDIAAMNGYLLKDIGLTRREAMHEAGKPFWRR